LKKVKQRSITFICQRSIQTTHSHTCCCLYGFGKQLNREVLHLFAKEVYKPPTATPAVAYMALVNSLLFFGL
jgi:hypothetical protein